MTIKVELKTNIINDTNNRIPPIDFLKKTIDDYSIGFNGIVTLHNSLYEYNYDTKGSSYNEVDSNQIVGTISSTTIENNKLYLIIDVNDKFDDSKDYICFFRSSMKTLDTVNSIVFDTMNIFGVDLIMIGDNENVTKDRLSDIMIIKE